MRLELERLEERSLPSVWSLLLALAPLAPLHYAPSDQPADPTSAGFNLVAVSSPAQLAQVPAGDRALVTLNKTQGVDADFLATIQPYVGDPRVWGFYVVDEPNPAVVLAANLQAEADWIHIHDPGVKAFFVMGAGPFLPFGPAYTPQNTHMDLVGLDPYASRTWGYHPDYIPRAVWTAELVDGWSPAQIVPVYQTFGGEGTFVQPSDPEVQVDLAIWGLLVPHPAFDYAYSWADWSGVSMVDRPDLQALFAEHNGR